MHEKKPLKISYYFIVTFMEKKIMIVVREIQILFLVVREKREVADRCSRAINTYMYVDSSLYLSTRLLEAEILSPDISFKSLTIFSSLSQGGTNAFVSTAS